MGINGLEFLTEEENCVLDLVKQVGTPIGEHEFHMIVCISTNLSEVGIYNFEPMEWEMVDGKYKTGLGGVPYSQELHKLVDSLVAKNYLSRDSNSPLIIDVTGNTVDLSGYYKLSGSYLLNEVVGSQNGSIYCYSDGKVLGIVPDNNKNESEGDSVYGTRDLNKLLIGYITPDLKFLFLKLGMPLYIAVPDIIWGLKGRYDKHLIFSGGWNICLEATKKVCELIPNIESVLRENVSDLNSLKNIVNITPINIFRERLFFNNQICDEIIKDSLLYGQTGEITLEKL